MIGKEYRWYVLKTKNQHEQKVLDFCTSLNIHCYLPLRKSLRIWSDRKKWLNLPMFPGYLFVYVSCKDFFLALSSPSVFDYIRFDNIPASLSETQIEMISIIEAQTLENVMEKRKFSFNDEVEVAFGPLKGIKGKISSVNRNSYLTLAVGESGSSIRLMIDSEMVIGCG